ncbi:MAG: hypothetical protein PHT99_07040 [Methanoregula sp.]|nr:hypothetical protein [Methanoregula sp.]
MHDLLKKIFGTKKPVPQEIAFDAVPAWLTARESAAKESLVSGTKEPMDTIRNGIAGLHLIINNIAGAEHDPAIHPKLKSIAKNTLPQFIKAMKGSLAKDLPEDPEEFYAAATECAKNCINCSRGQGRYLQAIFPEEMKAVRQGISTLGHGINAINPQLTVYRKEMTDVAAARALFDAVIDLRIDYNKSEEKLERAHTRIAEFENRSAAIEQELGAIPRDARMGEIDAQKSAIADIARQRDEAVRTYSALSMTASHVFRKAEKIATRQHHPTEIAIFNTAMEILSDHNIPDREQLDMALAAACPVAERMIAADEVLLKNKEERAVFSDTAAFRSDICTTSSSLRELEESCHKAEATLSAHPLITKTQSLEREKMQIGAMLDKERQALTELDEWRSKTAHRIPEVLLELKEKIMEISEGNVQLQMNDPTPS